MYFKNQETRFQNPIIDAGENSIQTLTGDNGLKYLHHRLVDLLTFQWCRRSTPKMVVVLLQGTFSSL